VDGGLYRAAVLYGRADFGGRDPVAVSADSDGQSGECDQSVLSDAGVYGVVGLSVFG